MRQPAKALLLAVLVSLTGCSGGGSSPNPVVKAPQPAKPAVVKPVSAPSPVKPLPMRAVNAPSPVKPLKLQPARTAQALKPYTRQTPGFGSYDPDKPGGLKIQPIDPKQAAAYRLLNPGAEDSDDWWFRARLHKKPSE